MTAQEKQVTLQNLQIVTRLFQEFEEANNMVISLPNQKRTALSTPEEMGELFQDTLQHASPLATSLQMFTMGSPLKYTMIVYLAAYFIAIIPAFMAGRLVGMLFGKSAIMTVYMILSIIGTIYIGRFIKKQINKIIHSGDKRLQDKIRGYQEAADRHNAEINRQIAIAQKKCDEVRQKIARLDMSWYLPNYCCSDASAFFYKALINGMCETLGEAAVLYEEHLFRNQVWQISRSKSGLRTSNVFCRARRSQPFETSTRKQEALYTTSTRKQEEPYTSNTRLPEVLSRLREKR